MNHSKNFAMVMVADGGSGTKKSTTPIQEDKSGQAVVNSGIGIAHKQNQTDDLHMIDAAGKKVLAKSGKEKFEKIGIKNNKNFSFIDAGGGVSPDNAPGTIDAHEVINEGGAPEDNSGGGSTGNSGIGAMLGQDSQGGMSHSWDKEAKQYADKLYQQGKAEAESEYSVKASELKTEAQQSQEDLEMQRYTNAQTADKLGWTGGYLLDQQRQMNVLKAGIQAQLYNTQELNRLGLESSLAAARLNADLKNQELAHQYYQDAVTNAINVAQTTGFYLPPEASDYLTQQRAAEQIMATADPNSAEYAKAQNIINYVDNYFSENGLSKQGSKTLSYMQYEISLRQQEMQEKQLEISYIMSSKQSTEYLEGKAGLYYDENGNTAFAGTTETDSIGSGPDLVNFSSITKEELERICNLNEKNSSFYEQCIDYKLNEIAEHYNNYLNKQGVTASEESWKTFSTTTGKDLIANYNDLLSANITSFTPAEIRKTSAANYDNFSIDSGLSLTFTPEDKQKDSEGKDVVPEKSLTDKILTSKDDLTTSTTYDEILNSSEGSHDFTSHVTYKVQNSAISGKGIDDDFDVNIYWDGKETKNYDLDVDWEYGSGWNRFWAHNNFGTDHEIGGVKGKDAWNKAQSYLTSTYGKQDKDNFVIYGGYLWYYNASLNKWGYVQKNTGGQKLLEDLKEAAAGSRPSRWS